MTDLFQEGIPAQEAPVKSAEIRGNFTALYDKLKTLEARATTPESTKILVTGGPVYFRSGSNLLYDVFGSPISGAMQFVDFKTSVIDLATANGFRTILNLDGTKSKEAVFGGISPFASTGLFREILVTLNNQGRLSFTEGATTTTGLSRSFDIAFDDAEIPICLVIVQQSGSLFTSGQLGIVRQIDMKEVRPVITTAFQNNIAGAALQQAVADNTNRISTIEKSFKSSDSLKVRIPPVEKLTIDGTTTTNIKLEVLSGSTYVSGKYVKYPGGFLSLAPLSALPVDNFARALIAMNASGAIVIYHPTSTLDTSNAPPGSLPSAVRDGYGNLTPPAGIVPLCIVTYRMDSTSMSAASVSGVSWSRTSNVVTVTSTAHSLTTGTTINVFGSTGGSPNITTGAYSITVTGSNTFTFPFVGTNDTSGNALNYTATVTMNIKPMTSEIFLDPNAVTPARFSFAFDITAITTPTQFVVRIPADVTYTDVLKGPIGMLPGQFVDLLDDNTRPFRRVITNNPQATFDTAARTMTIIVDDSFVSDVSFPTTIEGLSLKRNPKAVAVDKDMPILEDVRPFIAEL